MSKSPIVARRRGCQLATTVPVLTPPGKPSTWFPGEGLVTQAGLCRLLSDLFLKHLLTSDNFKIRDFIWISVFQNLTLNLLKF